jgi:iron complex transport system substrate-binding protein
VRILAALIAAISCFSLAACGNSGPDNADTASVTNGPRVVTLSPHLAELVFDVGAGDLLVGVSAYTDYPDAARSLPVIGDAFNLDLERLTLLEPDLLLAWDQGTPQHVIDQLRHRGFRVETVTTTHIADIGSAMRRIGELTGREAGAQAAARSFEAGVAELAASRAGEKPITVFYQVDARPLYTVSGAHYVSEIIALCGGVNIFAGIGGLAPMVSVEAVLERNPEVIFASTDAGTGAFDQWLRWPELAANRYQNRFLIEADEIGRATPRLLAAAGQVCDALSQARRNRERIGND